MGLVQAILSIQALFIMKLIMKNKIKKCKNNKLKTLLILATLRINSEIYLKKLKRILKILPWVIFNKC